MTIYGRAPFTYTDNMLELSKRLKGNSRYSTAKNVFEWMQKNIGYNNYASGLIRSLFLNYDYKSAHQVFREGEGICLDQAYLYCVLARYAGISSNVVKVKRDYEGDDVSHACSCVDVGNERLLVDTAYHRFDAKHKNYIVMSDEEAIKKYYSMCHCYENKGGAVEKRVVHDKPCFEDASSEPDDIPAFRDSVNSWEFFRAVNRMPNLSLNKISDSLNFEHLNPFNDRNYYLEYLRKEWREHYSGRNINHAEIDKLLKRHDEDKD